MSSRADTLRWNRRRHCWQKWSGRRWLEAAYSLDPSALRDPADPTVNVAEQEVRQRLMQQVREDEVLHGAEVLDATPSSVTLMTRVPVSHGLHLVLTLLTGGLWAAGWLFMVLARQENRQRLEIDRSGHVWVVEARG